VTPLAYLRHRRRGVDFLLCSFSMHHRTRIPPGLCGRFLGSVNRTLERSFGLSQMAAGASGFAEMYPMPQSVQQGPGQLLTAEDSHPGLKRQIGRYN